jgi:hypothetical protein
LNIAIAGLAICGIDLWIIGFRFDYYIRRRKAMDANECKQERLSSRTIGFIILIVSLLLLGIGMIILPVVGFIFALPLIILGVTMMVAPESKACRLIRQRLKAR